MTKLALRTALLAVATIAASAQAQPGPSELRTLAEQTQFRRTGRYAEVQQLCAAFVRAYPKQTVHTGRGMKLTTCIPCCRSTSRRDPP